MTISTRLTALGWTFHGEGCWTLTRAGHVALKAQSLFDGKWLIYEDQGAEGDDRWGEVVRTATDEEMVGVGESR
jgi:hypothetical protein